LKGLEGNFRKPLGSSPHHSRPDFQNHVWSGQKKKRGGVTRDFLGEGGGMGQKSRDRVAWGGGVTQRVGGASDGGQTEKK